MIRLILMREFAKNKRKNDKTQIRCLGLMNKIPVVQQGYFHIEVADYSSLYGSDPICARTNKDLHV